MGFFKKLFDDVLGLDPSGQGIYGTARGVLGNKVADDILGMDPTGKGAIKAYNVAIPLAAGYYGADALGAFDGFGSTATAGGSAGAAGGSSVAGMGTGVGLTAGGAGLGTGIGAGIGTGVGTGIGAGAGALAGSTLGSTLANYAMPAALVASGFLGANAAKSAAQTQAQSAAQANELLYKMYQEQKGLQEPFRGAGITAQNKLLDLLGLSSNTGAEGFGKYAKDFSMSDFEADPGYAFRLAEGQKGLDRQAAARGGLISGGALKAAARYGQDMGSQEYQSAFNRYQTNRSNQLAPLGSLLSTGQAAASNTGAAAGNYGAQAGGNITSAGAANAAGTVDSANSLTNALNSYLRYSSNNNVADAIRRSTYGG
jgi:hypothetical protein